MSEDIRIGDRFRVDIEVWHIPSDGTYGCMFKRADGARENRYLPAIILRAAKRLPRAIKVGDKVIGPHGGHYTVLAIDGPQAWIGTRIGERQTVEIEDITLADEAAS